MASSSTAARRPALRGRRAAITLFAAAGVLVTTAPAQAAPGAEPTTAAEAAELVAERGHQLEVLTEQFNDARVALETDQAAATQAAADAQAAQAAFDAARGSVTDVARTAYQGGSQLTGLQTLLSAGSADQFVEQAATLDMLSQHTTQVLDAAQQANDAAAAAQQQAEQATTEAQAQLDAVSAQQAELNAEIADYQAQYDRLSAAEQAAILASHGGGDTAATASSGGSGSGSGSSSSAAAPASTVVANSAAAQTAVDTAMAQRGDPYVWAASGPNSFDCSGLVQYAYAAAGISLPHSSRAQASMGQAVSRADLQPGDLVAFYSPVSHIGIYIGNGQMVHAPTSGDVVKVASIDAMGSSPTAYRRIAG